MTISQVRNDPGPLDRSTPNPARDYDEAQAKFAQLQALDGDDLNPVNRSKLLSHGRKTDHALILIHGITNSPQQFTAFAPLCFDRGYNVLIPRMPRNGLADRMTDELKNLKASELRTFCDDIVDIATGLGDRVTVAGLSAGGVLAAWIAQFRPDVDLAVPMAPSFGILADLPVLNGPINGFVKQMFLHVLPNINTQTRAPFKGAPPHTYLGFSTRSLGEVMRLGTTVFNAASRHKAAAKHVLMVLNENDNAVNNQMSSGLVRRWQRHATPNQIATFLFERHDKLIHDLIDPLQEMQQTEKIYPVLLPLICPEEKG